MDLTVYRVKFKMQSLKLGFKDFFVSVLVAPGRPTFFSGKHAKRYPSELRELNVTYMIRYGTALLHGLVFAMTCDVNSGTLYRQVCAVPNHVQSIEFTTGELQ